MKNENGNSSDNGGRTTISSETRVTLNFVWSVIAILGPLVSMLFMLHNSQQDTKVKLDKVNSTLQAIQVQVGDRWTRSMMVLFASELELRNRNSSNSLQVPNPEDIARRVPSEYLRP